MFNRQSRSTTQSSNLPSSNSARVGKKIGNRIGKRIWQVMKYLLFFVVVYIAINWWRKPIMPVDPQLQLTTYQGQTIDIETLSHESPVLVYFWGSWCGVCKVTSPIIDTLADSSFYPIVTIAVQSGDNNALKKYLTAQNFDFTTINDESGALFNDWQGQVTPSYVILKDGEMTQGLTGIQPLWSLKLRLWLASIG